MHKIPETEHKRNSMLQFFMQYDTIIKVSVGYSLANAFCSEEQNQEEK